jgi:1,4-dihydroxy-2-naphthoate octaprenyltransferase
MSEGAAATERPGRLRVLALAIRPRTLTCALVPALLGTAVAARLGRARLDAALASLLGYLLVQIGTNLVNDYADAERGADTHERLGPPRVTQSGLADARTVKRWAALAFALAWLPGIYCVALGGWPILALGVLSIAAGYAYTAGPYPLGYNGLGDVFVLVFFGFGATLGACWVQARALPPLVFLCAIPAGCLAMALLAVNNLRDAPTDAEAGKRTIAVRFGTGAARVEYCACIALSLATPPVIFLLGLAGPWALLPLLAAPLAVKPLLLVLSASGRTLNEALAGTALLHLAVGLLLAAGLAV